MSGPKETRKAPGAKLTKAPIKKKDEEEAADPGDGVDEGNPGKPNKSADHLELTEEELKQEIAICLTANNPHAPQNIVRYNFKERSYKACRVDQTAEHFEVEGSLLHEDCEEARRLRAKKDLLTEKATSGTGAETDDDHTGTPGSPVEEGGEAEEAGKEGRPDSVASKADAKEPKLANQFNFNERAAQTLNYPLREKLTQTELPQRSTLSCPANQWEIYDAYVEELQKQEKNKEKPKSLLLKKDKDKSKEKNVLNDTQGDDLSKMVKISKVLERMLTQNAMDDIDQDFKYFEDASDNFRGKEGTLLPLWKFEFERVRNLTVTALCWNNNYEDMFAVGLGSYEFGKVGQGMLLFYSLKNPAFPEYIYPTAIGVQCLDIHKQHSYLVATGFYDGNVAVYNLKEDGEQPTYKSTVKTGKHTDPVWQVCWQNDDIDNHHNFYSVSSDGRVVAWTLTKNELIFTDIIKLSVNNSISDIEVAPLARLYAGTSFDFHKQIEYLFLVGTEEGKIHKCSKAYSSQYVETYNAHCTAVYAVRWNCFHPKVFISCGPDWTIKIWDHTVIKPMFTFRLHTAVEDVAWAPYSSTVFAAVTRDGLVHVFDISINKYEAICEQRVVSKKSRLTHIAFNPIHPIVIVGDDQGCVNSFKLSPNLRKLPKNKKGEQLPTAQEAEIEKMEKILSFC